ncbi:MAG: hypothetical protein JJU03_11045 [Idiomarina sp.]|nr:hypothetical protein [Idiomarina sp.]
MPNTLAASANTQINLPPALRQLLAEHAQLHQLLPQLRALQSTISQPAGASTASTSNPANAQLLSALLPLLTQQLATPGQQLNPLQLRQLVSQWFSFHPGQALSSPPPAASASWMSQLGPMLQWLLVQRSSHQPLTQLLQQATAGNAAPSAVNITPPTLAALSALLLGSMQDIRLSQVHLADTSGQMQPEYYLVLPYQVGDKAHVLEWLLKKQARTPQQPAAASWQFSLRFATQSYGPILVKGRYSGVVKQREGQQPVTELRFYLQGDVHQQTGEAAVASFKTALDTFTQRLSKAGVGDIQHEVYLGVVPDSLAPTAHELVKSKTQQRGPYG